MKSLFSFTKLFCPNHLKYQASISPNYAQHFTNLKPESDPQIPARRTILEQDKQHMNYSILAKTKQTILKRKQKYYTNPQTCFYISSYIELH